MSHDKNDNRSLKREDPSHLPARAPGARNLRRASENNTATAVGPKLVLGTMRRRWKLVFPLGLCLAAAAATAVWFVVPREYRATAMFRITDRNVLAFEVEKDSKTFVETQMELIRSAFLLRKLLPQDAEQAVVQISRNVAAENGDNAGDDNERKTVKENYGIAAMPEIRSEFKPVEWLGSRLGVRRIGTSQYFELSFVGPNGTNAATIVDAVLDVYIETYSGEREERFQSFVDVLENTNDERKVEIELLRENLIRKQQNTLGSSPLLGTNTDDRHVLADPLLATHSALLQKKIFAEVDHQVLKAQLEALGELTDDELEESTNDETAVSTITVQQAISQQREIVELQNRIDELRTKQTGINRTAKLGERDPTCLALEEEINDLTREMTELYAKLPEEVSASVQDNEAFNRRGMIRKLEADIASSAHTADLLSDEIVEIEKEIAKGIDERKATERDTVKSRSQAMFDLEFDQRELERKEEMHALFARKITEWKTEHYAPERVQRIEEHADVPTEPETLIPFKQLLPATALAFALPFLLAVAWEYRTRPIADCADLENATNLKVIGEIAKLPARLPRAQRIRKLYAPSFYVETVNNLSTHLVLSNGSERSTVVAVTSSIGREGKTSVSAQLAISWARATGQPVLIIDGDLRAPDIHNVFGVPNERGLANYLNGECPATEVIMTDQAGGVDVMPGGYSETSPHVLFGNGSMKNLLETLRGMYKYIVIDTPPILGASEALVLAQSADDVLFCALRDVSQASRLSTAHARLVNINVTPIGAVLSGMPARPAYSSKYASK